MVTAGYHLVSPVGRAAARSLLGPRSRPRLIFFLSAPPLGDVRVLMCSPAVLPDGCGSGRLAGRSAAAGARRARPILPFRPPAPRPPVFSRVRLPRPGAGHVAAGVDRRGQWWRERRGCVYACVCVCMYSWWQTRRGVGDCLALETVTPSRARSIWMIVGVIHTPSSSRATSVSLASNHARHRQAPRYWDPVGVDVASQPTCSYDHGCLKNQTM